jgi:hypothetical protein
MLSLILIAHRVGLQKRTPREFNRQLRLRTNAHVGMIMANLSSPYCLQAFGGLFADLVSAKAVLT